MCVDSLKIKELSKTHKCLYIQVNKPLPMDTYQEENFLDERTAFFLPLPALIKAFIMVIKSYVLDLFRDIHFNIFFWNIFPRF